MLFIKQLVYFYDDIKIKVNFVYALSSYFPQILPTSDDARLSNSLYHSQYPGKSNAGF